MNIYKAIGITHDILYLVTCCLVVPKFCIHSDHCIHVPIEEMALEIASYVAYSSTVRRLTKN